MLGRWWVQRRICFLSKVFKTEIGADILVHTDRSLTVLCPIIFPQSALVFALTDGLGS